MSVADLKVSLRDVPGIQNLSMRLASGSILLEWGNGYSAIVGAAASDAEIMSAVRNAVRLPPVALIPEKDAPMTEPVAPAAPMTGISPAMTNPASAGLNVKELMQEHTKLMGEIHAAQVQLLAASLAKQREAVSGAVGSVVKNIDQQTDDFLAIMGQFSNGAVDV